MSRVEELTLLWLDGAANEAARNELARLVDTDAEARRIHLCLIDVEVSLRGGRPAEVSSAVMEQVARERSDRAVWGVLQHLSSIKPVSRGPRAAPVRSRRATTAIVLVALSSIAAAFIGVNALVPEDNVRTAASSAPVQKAPVRSPQPVGPPVVARAALPRETPGPAPVAAPALGSAVPQSSPPTQVLGFDFENGDLPEEFIDGHLVPCPSAPGSRLCVLGTMSPYDASRNTVTIERLKPSLFPFASGQVLSFDYWVGADAPVIRVQLWVRSRRENFAIFLRDLVRERWGHAEIRLADLRSHGHARRLAPSDGIGNIMITAGRMGGSPFYVDNLKVVAYPADASLPETAAGLARSP